MFKTFLILSGAISALLATPLKEENLEPHTFGFEMPSQDEIDRLDAEEGVESNLMFEGIPIKFRVNRNLAREDDDYIEPSDESISEEGITEEPMPYFNQSDMRSGRYGEHLDQYMERYVNPDGYGKYPWQVYIRFARSACTGSAICPRIVLTAGHCVAGNSPSQTRVYQSPSSTCPPNTRSVQALQFAMIYTLNRYRYTDPRCHDIAWIRLQTPLSSYYNILGGVSPPPYSHSIGAGYGQTGTGTGPVRNSCTSTYSRFGPSGCTFRNPGQWICVDANRANGGACRGDSGGPLTARQLVGVASFFYGRSNSCFDQIRSVYARISRYASATRSVVNSFGGCR